MASLIKLLTMKDAETQSWLRKVEKVGVEVLVKALLGADDFNPSPEYVINMLQSGSIRLVLLPGEPFVEYQLYIQSLIPDEFVAVAANCRDDFLYLPLANSFNETGGYETEYFCRTTPEFEPRFKDAVSTLISQNSGK